MYIPNDTFLVGAYNLKAKVSLTTKIHQAFICAVYGKYISPKLEKPNNNCGELKTIPPGWIMISSLEYQVVDE